MLNLTGWRERGFYGRAYRVKENLTAQDLLKRLHMTLSHEVEVLEHQFTRNQVQTIRGEACFVDPNTIDIKIKDGEVIQCTADKFLLAVGTKPFRPENIPFDKEYILDSDEILEIKKIPRSLVVVGAGVIGIEYATIFSALDVAVTVIEPRASFLDFIDPWGNRIEIVGYENIQFTKAPHVLRGMGIENIEKNQKALDELAGKGMAPD